MTGPKDLTDWVVDYGATMADILAVIDGAVSYKPEVDKQAATGAGDPGLTKKLADSILATERFARDAGGRLYRYENGAYRAGGEREIQKRVKCFMDTWGQNAQWTTHRAHEVVAYIATDAPDLWPEPPANTVNLANGLLDLVGLTLREHSPDYLSTVQIPVKYDPLERCPEIERFVETTFPADAQTIAYEIPGWSMAPMRSIQKAILLIGEGSNGKSTYLSLLRTFLGRSNYSTLSLQKLETDRFAAAGLLGKLANICPYLPSAHLTDTDVFKNLTGGEEITGEYKHLDAFKFEPFAKLLFSANTPPRSSESTHAFFRRWQVVPFTRTFATKPGDGEVAEIPRHELDEKLSRPVELSGLLNKAIEARRRILANNNFTQAPSMTGAWKAFREATDPISVWLDQNTIEDPGAHVGQKELRAAYSRHCEKTGIAMPTPHTFTKGVKRHYPNMPEPVQRSVNGRMEWAWIGIGIGSEQAGERKRPNDSHDSHDFLPFAEHPKSSVVSEEIEDIDRRRVQKSRESRESCEEPGRLPAAATLPQAAANLPAPAGATRSQIEHAILDRLADGTAHHGELIAEARSAGAGEAEARAAVGRLQAAGEIYHTLSNAGYALGHAHRSLDQIHAGAEGDR